MRILRHKGSGTFFDRVVDQNKVTTYIPFFITMSDEDLPQEIEETLNEKAGIIVLIIDNSENVSIMTEIICQTWKLTP